MPSRQPARFQTVSINNWLDFELCLPSRRQHPKDAIGSRFIVRRSLQLCKNGTPPVSNRDKRKTILSRHSCHKIQNHSLPLRRTPIIGSYSDAFTKTCERSMQSPPAILEEPETMSSKPELSRVRPQPSSSTTTALMLTYRPIIFLLFAGPVLLLSLPLVVATFGVLDTTTGQHTLLTLGTTALFSKLLESSIAKAAPTKEIAATSLERSRSGLLLVAFLTSALAIRFVVTPLGKALGSEAILEWSPSISIVSASRLAFGFFLLGFSVGKNTKSITKGTSKTIAFKRYPSVSPIFFALCLSRSVYRTAVYRYVNVSLV